jgi:hypothetical protein
MGEGLSCPVLADWQGLMKLFMHSRYMLARRTKSASVRFLNWDNIHQLTLSQGSHDEIASV